MSIDRVHGVLALGLVVSLAATAGLVLTKRPGDVHAPPLLYLAIPTVTGRAPMGLPVVPLSQDADGGLLGKVTAEVDGLPFDAWAAFQYCDPVTESIPRLGRIEARNGTAVKVSDVPDGAFVEARWVLGERVSVPLFLYHAERQDSLKAQVGIGGIVGFHARSTYFCATVVPHDALSPNVTGFLGSFADTHALVVDQVHGAVWSAASVTRDLMVPNEPLPVGVRSTT